MAILARKHKAAGKCYRGQLWTASRVKGSANITSRNKANFLRNNHYLPGSVNQMKYQWGFSFPLILKPGKSKSLNTHLHSK